MQQVLPSLHIILTCSFILLLAYLLFTISSFIASSLIHGRSVKARRRGSLRLRSSSRNPPLIEREIEEELQAKPLMDRLQEDDEEQEDEEDEEGDTYADAKTRTAPETTQASRGFELTDSIFFEDRPIADDHDVGRGKYSEPKDDDRRIADIGKTGDRELGEDKGRYGAGDAGAEEVSDTFSYHQDKKIENGQKWEMKEGQDSVKELSNGNDSSSTKLGDPQGSGSMRQRLPPTWSDLEKMVNMNSSKNLLSPS